ncbi:MAG: tetratricopeptide repeat protein [Salinivirgaceae bacterium]
MLKWSFLLSAFLLVSITQGQDEKKIKQLYKEADTHFLYEEFDLALPFYLQLIGEGWENANIYNSIGMCYLNSSGNESLAIPYLEKAITNISANYKEGNYKEDRAPQEALFYLAKAYRLNGQFDKAIQTYKQYQGYIGVSDVYLIDFVALQIKTCETAIQMTANPIYFVENELSIGQSG